MNPSNLSIPFKSTDLYSGLAEMEGILHVDSQTLTIEFQVKDSVFGMIKGKTKSLDIPYSALSEVEFKSNIFVTRFLIHVNSMKILNQFPASKNGAIKLKVKRKNRHRAFEMETFIRQRMHDSGYALPDEDEKDPFLN